MSKALVMSMLFALAGCRPDGSAEEEVMNPQSAAILRVLQRHAQLVGQRAEAEALQTQTSQVALVWRRFCEELERMDLTACPADFRVALRQHTRACRDVQAAIEEFPDGFADGFFAGFLSSLGGEYDGGIGRLESQYRSAYERGAATFAEVERTALKYGVAL